MKLATYYKLEEKQFCRLMSLDETELTAYDKIYFFSEQENIEVQDIKKEQDIIVKQKETLQELSVFDLDNLLVSIEHLIKYYTNLAMANDGLYTHDTKVLYTNARNKIQSLEYKKTEILLELEKRILN